MFLSEESKVRILLLCRCFFTNVYIEILEALFKVLSSENSIDDCTATLRSAPNAKVDKSGIQSNTDSPFLISNRSIPPDY